MKVSQSNLSIRKESVVIFSGGLKLSDNTLLILDENLNTSKEIPLLDILYIYISKKVIIELSDLLKINSFGVTVIIGDKGVVSTTSGLLKRNSKLKLTQINKAMNSELRLKTSKSLLELRERFFRKNFPGRSTPVVDFSKALSVSDLLLLEALWMKRFYVMSASFNKTTWEGRIAEFAKKNPVYLFNNLSYGISKVVINGLNLDHDMGFIHGHTRGMGLVYDLADIIKPVVSIELSNRIKESVTDWPTLKMEFFNCVQESKAVEFLASEVVKVIKS